MTSTIWLSALSALLVGAGLTWALVPVVARLAWRLGAVDHPGGRRHHRGAVPRLGGAALLGGILGGLFVGWLLLPAEWAAQIDTGGLGTLLAAAVAVFLVGASDDIWGMRVSLKALVQLAAAIAIVARGWSFHLTELPWVGIIDFGDLGPALSVLWVVGICNAINLIDGLDGLAGGIAAIISSSFLVLALFIAAPGVVILSAVMAGAAIGFLGHNWAPARVFLGDSGSLLLGFLLATLSLQASLKSSAAVAILVPFLALGLPVIDTLLVMVVRFLEAPGHPVLRRVARMFKADRRHLHHLLLALAPRRSQVLWSLYGLALLFCIGALIVAVSKSPGLGVVLIVVEIIAIFLIRRVSIRAHEQAAAAPPREAAGAAPLDRRRAEG